MFPVNAPMADQREHCPIFTKSTRDATALVSLPLLQRTTIEVLRRDRVRIDTFEAADIDGSHGFSLRISTFPVGMDPAIRTKTVLDYMLVEGVCTDHLFRAEQLQPLAGDEPQHRSFAGTD